MLVIGHRGARGLAPENTLAGLQKALEHHVDMLEFDIRVTKDGVPVLHHGKDLMDGDGRKHRLSQTSFAELRQHKPDLASLEEVLKAIDRHVQLYIEAKKSEPVRQTIKLLKNSHRAAGNTFLASKHQKTLLALHKALPEFPTIVIEPWSGVRGHWRARQLGTKYVAMNQKWLWWGFIRGFKNNDWQLYAYTLNDVKKVRRWAKYGLAGVVTDYPDRFQRHP